MDYTLLVAVESPARSNGLDTYLTELCRHTDTRLVLMHVTPDLSDIDPAQAADIVTAARAMLRDYAGRLALPDERIAFRIGMGDAATEIVKATIIEQAGIVALATRTHSGLERLVEGSVAESVMRRAHCPALICRADHAPAVHGSGRAIEKILVPLDGSDQSARIIDTVADLAHLTGARIILYHDDQGYLELETPETALDVGSQLDEYQQRLTAEGLEVEVEMSQLGKPAEEILHKTEELGVDLVAMTTHGRRGVSRLLFGSVAESVLYHGGCPLLVLSTSPTRRLEQTER